MSKRNEFFENKGALLKTNKNILLYLGQSDSLIRLCWIQFYLIDLDVERKLVLRILI